MANTLVKLSEIEKSLAQQEAGIQVKNAENKNLLAEEASVSFRNIILKIATEASYESVALLSEIFAADGTAENEVVAIQRMFLEGRDLLNNLRDVTRCMFPYRQAFLGELHDPMKLTLARFAKHGWLMTNTCNTDQKSRKLLREVKEAETKENEMMEDEINVYKADCWHHLCNVWIGGAILELGQHLAEVLINDLEAIPFMLCVTTNVTNIGRATEKYLGLQAKYVKVSLYLLHWLTLKL